MSEPMTCPGCGANVREEHFSYRRFECMTLEFDAFGPIQYELRESADCLRRQLAQRDEKLKKLATWAVRLWDGGIHECSGEPQEIGEELGIVELRPVEPGSPDAEEWGDDAELYYLVDWVREIGGEHG